MREIVYTLLSDGSSDRRLMFPINWLIGELTDAPFRGQWADLRGQVALRDGLEARVIKALELYPCDILIVHRDAESPNHQPRESEINTATTVIAPQITAKLIPVRMQEAWFLIDEPAIRRASGRPSGTMNLAVPSIRRLEDLPDPKATLHAAIRTASGHRGRKLQRLDLNDAVTRVAEVITNYSALRLLPAYERFEADLTNALSSLSLRQLIGGEKGGQPSSHD